MPLSGPVEVDVTVYYEDARSYWFLIAGIVDYSDEPYPGTVTTSIGPCDKHVGTWCAVKVPSAATSEGRITFMFQVQVQPPPPSLDPYTGAPIPYVWNLRIFSGFTDFAYNTIHDTVRWTRFGIEVHGARIITGRTTTTTAQPSPTATTASQPIPTTTTPTSTPLTAWGLETFEIYVGWAVAAVLAIALVGYVAYHRGKRSTRRR